MGHDVSDGVLGIETVNVVNCLSWSALALQRARRIAGTHE